MGNFRNPGPTQTDVQIFLNLVLARLCSLFVDPIAVQHQTLQIGSTNVYQTILDSRDLVFVTFLTLSRLSFGFVFALADTTRSPCGRQPLPHSGLWTGCRKRPFWGTEDASCTAGL